MRMLPTSMMDLDSKASAAVKLYSSLIRQMENNETIRGNVPTVRPASDSNYDLPPLLDNKETNQRQSDMNERNAVDEVLCVFYCAYEGLQLLLNACMPQVFELCTYFSEVTVNMGRHKRSRRSSSTSSSNSSSHSNVDNKKRYRRELRKSNQHIKVLEGLVKNLRKSQDNQGESSLESLRSSRPIVRYFGRNDFIPEFYPRSSAVPIEHWLRNLESISKIHGWDEPTLICNCTSKLRGYAKSISCELTDDVICQAIIGTLGNKLLEVGALSAGCHNTTSLLNYLASFMNTNDNSGNKPQEVAIRTQ
ncbi:hypothetical protein HW555_006782 [Spodoptera exigua]|uniref:Uncharacterized protein n=1 Tax=Spodoptera exigua TaxID=7107 RepID=A0A835GHJ4_SPOEX|nr:hypothetical protein HW555_006782 [Spodoptera exigua]